MKNFLAIEAGTAKRGRWEYLVYHVKNNRLCYLGKSDFTYASTRGFDSEVMNWLSANGHIAKKYIGYYMNHDKKPFHITTISPLNQK